MIVEQVQPEEGPVKELLAFVVHMHFEVGIFAPDPDKAAAEVYRICAAGFAFVARAEEGGPIVGSMGLTEFTPWYSSELAIANQWLYVAPEHRGGPALRHLLRVAREFGQAEGKAVIIELEGPNRDGGAVGCATQVGFMPIGRSVRIGGSHGEKPDVDQH